VNQQLEKSKRTSVLGVELEWQFRSDDTGDRYCVLTATLERGIGIPPHQHPDQEAFFVLEGQPEFAVSDSADMSWRVANPGEMVNIPPDAMHGFRNASDRRVKVLITCAPGLGRFLEEAGTPLPDDQTGCPEVSPDDIERVLAIAARHGQRFPIPA